VAASVTVTVAAEVATSAAVTVAASVAVTVAAVTADVCALHRRPSSACHPGHYSAPRFAPPHPSPSRCCSTDSMAKIHLGLRLQSASAGPAAPAPHGLGSLVIYQHGSNSCQQIAPIRVSLPSDSTQLCLLGVLGDFGREFHSLFICDDQSEVNLVRS
jgi:hypothetical protein